MQIPTFLHAFIDDAAIFPPGNLPLDEALAAHAEHREAEYADLVGPFIVNDGRLPELTTLVEEARHEPSRNLTEPIAINLVVTGGAGAISGAVTWAQRAEGVTLNAVEFALRDEDDLAHNAARVVAACDDIGLDCPIHVEPPRLRGAEPTHGWLSALDVLADREIPLKFRLGGVDPDMVPTSVELAASINAALDRELPFKCTAGLHHAIRNVAGHGFLNVLLATRANLDGEDAVAMLEERDPQTLLAKLDPDTMQRTRKWFTSFGSCSILEPHDDLVELGVIA